MTEESKNRARKLLADAKAQVLVRDQLIDKRNECSCQLKESLDQLRIKQKALETVNTIANLRRESLKGDIEGVLSDAVRLVYGENYSISIDYSVKRGLSAVDFMMEIKNSKNTVLRPIKEGFGGGVSDVVSVPLRLMVLSKGNKDGNLFCAFDESYKHLDDERIPAVSSFLRELIDQLGVQMIFITHQPEFADNADKVFKVSNEDGFTKFKEVK